MNTTSIASYRKHRYSGPTKSRKRVRAQLKRYHGDETSRDAVWRKQNKKDTPPQSETAESAGQPHVKTYVRRAPILHIEATFSQKCSQPSTSCSSSTSFKTKGSEINRPVIDPTLASHEPTVDSQKCSQPSTSCSSSTSFKTEGSEINWPVIDPTLASHEPTVDSQKCSQPATSCSSSTSFKTEASEINWPVIDPTLASHEPTVDSQKCSQPSTSCSSSTSFKTEASEINWPVIDPTLASHEPTVEKYDYNNLTGLSGNRIVDIQHVLRWAFALEKHRKACENSTIEFVRELRTGFNSVFIFKCSMCDKEFRNCNENSDGDKLNKAFAWGTVLGGSNYTQASHITNVLDIPTMSAQTFRKIENSLAYTWKEQLTEEIMKVGEQERAIAIEKGRITEDGIPYIEVEVDGGWAKRSYGHDYNLASGMACIIGKNTKKCLYIGIKNKYCCYCHLYEKQSKDVPSHTCFENYQGSSTSMEAEILVEGFQKSEEMHGVQYLSFIGDGDSSVFAQLKEKVSYGQNIRKTECKNHLIKNYTSALYKVLGNTKLPLYGRKMLKNRLSKLTIISRKIIMHQANNRTAMRSDLQHGPSHVFGQHDKCKSYFCKYIETGERDENCVGNMKKRAPAVWALICAANEVVMAKTNRLSNETTNHVENFMNLISIFNCAKRFNLHKGGSYQ